MHQTVDIPLADLQLDPKNARLGEEQPSQQATYIALTKQQGRRILKLAEDIVNAGGTDPTTLPAVVATGDRHRRYKVLEGNRRVLALKALDTPSLITSALSSAEQKKLNGLSVRYAQNPVDPVQCVLFDTEEDAEHWIELRHTGQNEGAGLVEWDSNEKDRYQARHGTRGPRGQVMDFVAKHGILSDEAKRSNTRVLTNVQRLVNSPSVRQKLGLELVDGQLLSWYPTKEVAKGLSRIVNDLKTGTIKVNDIYYENDRKKYLSKFRAPSRPDPTKKLKAPIALDDLTAGRARPVTPPPKPRSRRRKVQTRASIVPSGCRINPTSPRINAIYNELESLSVDQYPNACGVLLRVFLELSVDDCLQRNSAMAEAQRRSTPLSKRLKVCADDLLRRGKINAQLKKAVYKIADSQHVLAASATTFNQYVHNQYVFPKPSELRTAWDELQPFLEAL